MRITNVWIDGGSFLLGMFFLSGVIGPLIGGVKVSNWFAGISLLLAIVFFWLSVRIGKKRSLLRDPSRWLPNEISDTNRK
jgi:hypothetical protein